MEVVVAVAMVERLGTLELMFGERYQRVMGAGHAGVWKEVLDREEASLDPVLDQACRLVRQTGWWQQGLPWCPSSTSV